MIWDLGEGNSWDPKNVEGLKCTETIGGKCLTFP